MEKCKICGTKLCDKAIDIDKILNEKEAKRLKSIRRKNGKCSRCSTEELIRTILGV